MKVLFLDCDGVLNSREFFRTSKEARSYGNMTYDGTWNDKDPNCWVAMLDSSKVGLLKDVVRNTGCKIVLSSTWRKHLSADAIKVPLSMSGFPDAPVVDATADFGTGGERSERGVEIRAWLDQHPEVTKYAVVDDDDDMGGISMDYFVQTSWDSGMQVNHVMKLIEILNS